MQGATRCARVCAPYLEAGPRHKFTASERAGLPPSHLFASVWPARKKMIPPGASDLEPLLSPPGLALGALGLAGLLSRPWAAPGLSWGGALGLLLDTVSCAETFRV